MAHVFTTVRQLIAARVESHDVEQRRFAQNARYAKTRDGVWIVWRDARPGRAAIVLPEQCRQELPCHWLAAAHPQHHITATIAFVEAGGIGRLQQLPRWHDPASGYRLFADSLSLRIGLFARNDPALETWVQAITPRPEPPADPFAPKPKTRMPPEPECPQLLPTLSDIFDSHQWCSERWHPCLPLAWR